jgi:hypothetical protein
MRKLYHILLVAVATVALTVPALAEQYWIPQQAELPASITGEWCLFGSLAARSDIPVGRSESYKTEKGCDNMVVSTNGFYWIPIGRLSDRLSGMRCTIKSVDRWWKNSDEWSAWRVWASCERIGTVSRVLQFEFIYTIPPTALRGSWPVLSVGAPPFPPDSVRNFLPDLPEIK